MRLLFFLLWQRRVCLIRFSRAGNYIAGDVGMFTHAGNPAFAGSDPASGAAGMARAAGRSVGGRLGQFAARGGSDGDGGAEPAVFCAV